MARKPQGVDRIGRVGRGRMSLALQALGGDPRMRRNSDIETTAREVGPGVWLDRFGRYTTQRPPNVASAALEPGMGWGTVDADAMLDPSERLQWLVDATGGAVTVTLPAASVAQSIAEEFDLVGGTLVMRIKKADASGNAVTVEADVNIDGATTVALASQYDAVTVSWGAGQWWI